MGEIFPSLKKYKRIPKMLKDLKKKHYANSHSAQVSQVFYINGNLIVSSKVVAEQFRKRTQKCYQRFRKYFK